MKRFTILLAVISLLNMSCKKEQQAIVCLSKVFAFYDLQGNNIFDSTTPGHLSDDDLRAYTPDGQILNVYPEVFEGEKLFQIDLNTLTIINNDTTNYWEGITYIEIGGITVDTVLARADKHKNIIYLTEVYYNGRLVFNGRMCDDSETIRVTVVPD